MDVQEVEITIDKNGQVQVQVRGVKGDQCLQLTKDLEEALGGEIVLREMTPEALEQQQQLDDQIYLRGSKSE